MAAILAAGVSLAACVAAFLVARDGTGSPPPGAERRAVASAERFLSTYVDPDGRVVRRDQGGDTVSEGQAYAMLVAVAVGDRALFERVWGWTRRELQRPDGLLAWRWADGRVAADEPAADADLDAARALVLAGRRFGERSWRAEGGRLGRAVLRGETVVVHGRHVLVAGPWARGTPPALNPSYLSPGAFRELGRASGDRRWTALERSLPALVRPLMERGPRLPPDWARLDAAGRARPAPAPHEPGAGSRYGADAVRLPVRLAEACGERTRELAGAPWPFFERELRRGLGLSYRLDGTRAGPDRHASALVGAAGAAHAAGHPGRARSLLAEAERLDRRAPTYYGAAWVALGRLLLTTDRLSACRD